MDPTLKLVFQNQDIWHKILVKIYSHLSVTARGQKIHSELEARFGWLKDPQSEQAFYEAFRGVIEKYETEYGKSAAGRSAIRVLADCLRDETSGLDLASVLDMILAGPIDNVKLSSLIRLHPVEFEDAL